MDVAGEQVESGIKAAVLPKAGRPVDTVSYRAGYAAVENSRLNLAGRGAGRLGIGDWGLGIDN